MKRVKKKILPGRRTKRSRGPWFAYILECEDGSFYTGIAKSPEARFQTHTAGRGARYTRSHRPVRIAFIEKQRGLSAAMKREIALKKLSKSRKRALIEAWKPENNGSTDERRA